MKNELPITVDMFRHGTSHGRSWLSLAYAGPPASRPSVLRKGRVGQEGRRGGLRPGPVTVFCAGTRRGQEVSAPPLGFPGRALEQDEVIRAGCQRIIAVSLLCKLHAQMLLFRIRPH